MNQSNIEQHPGYYLVTIRPSSPGLLLRTNNERAFIISCLQDSLSNRTVLTAINPSVHLAIHIDLLSFSILKEAVQLIVFTIAQSSLEALTNNLKSSLAQYQSDTFNRYTNKAACVVTTSSMRRLAGPHEALNMSVQLHLNHSDWEFDRYSSIGFYLHDRRGDWVRLWRLSQLYENTTSNYRHLIELAAVSHATQDECNETNYPLYATSKRA